MLTEGIETKPNLCNNIVGGLAKLAWSWLVELARLPKRILQPELIEKEKTEADKKEFEELAAELKTAQAEEIRKRRIDP